MLLAEHLGDHAVAGRGQAREQRLLLEREVALDIVLQRLREATDQPGQRHVGARRAADRALRLAQQREVGAMFVVEQTADLAREVHGGPIMVLKYQITTAERPRRLSHLKVCGA